MNWHIHEHLHISNEASKWKTGEYRVVFITLLTCLTRERGIWSHSFLTFFRPQLELELKTRHRLKNDRLPDFVHSETADEDVWNHQKSMRHTKSIYTSHPQKQFRPGTWSQLRRGNKGNRSDLNFAACVNIFWYNYKHITIHNIPTKGRESMSYPRLLKRRMETTDGDSCGSVCRSSEYMVYCSVPISSKGHDVQEKCVVRHSRNTSCARIAEQTSLAGSKWIYIKNMKK